ncbi:hypothetical protein Barb7_00956 [Bacteroidales bacterium Barb7]|nr:hypothetical protein Barb4_00410 [Bacteroidales bacterium Barb4]OAV75427.1 hypothetical protein Barb7_00956 [Bacteroidales bacterium Barb7]
MNTLKYKDYIGTVSYSEDDEVFFGKVEGINGLVNFEGNSVHELREAFEGAVDAYLDYCIQEGLPPDKHYTGTLNIRISPELHRKIACRAKKTGVTINAYIKDTLENKLKTVS